MKNKQGTPIIKDITQIFKKHLAKVLIVISLSLTIEMIVYQPLLAQVFGPQTIKWLWVSSLRQYFSSAGAEIMYGRRGRGPYLMTDQNDGLRWPAQYSYQDHNVGKALWIGTTNFTEPATSPQAGTTYPYKVIPLGRGALYVNSASYPVDFKLIGRFAAPIVTVDNASASDLDANDLNLSGGEDQIDPTLPADRMIYNVINTPIGITITRKVYAFTQQYHDNYYIYECVFKNTGFSDNTGGVLTPARTLTGLVFDFRYNFADANDAYMYGWGISYADVYGKNTINDAIGQDPAHTLPAPNDFRAIYEYFGPNSSSTDVSDDIGGPDFRDGHILSGESFIGEMVLHADKSSQDTTNDPNQPLTTTFMGSDGPIETITPTMPFNASVMTQQYQNMTAGHDAQTHAQQIGEDANGWPKNFADTWSGRGISTGGYHSQQGFGPYTLAPGDSVCIVIAEAVAGISREKNIEVAKNWWSWYNNNKSGGGPFVLPNGSTTADGNVYKNSWVFTGKDSLLQTFRRARANYNSGYHIPQPPPPPDNFTVTSGGDRIILQWSKSAESWPHFDGYRVYRAKTKTDTTFELIFSCNKSNVTNSFDDITASRGFNYFYYIQTKDDGSTNDIQPGEPLVSSMFYTMTNKPAYLPPVWRQLLSGTTNNLNGVSFADANTGTAVGDSGTILRTTNGGASWIINSSRTTNTLNGVSFTDTNTGTAVGDSGIILRTTNGGTSWISDSSGTTITLNGVCFTDANTGTVVGDSGTILRTTNGGASWTKQSSGTTNYLRGVSFINANTGTAVGDSGIILHTTNRGTSWTKQSSGTTNTLNGVSLTSAYQGKAVGDSGTIVVGGSWMSQSSGTYNNLYGVSFTDASTGTVVGDNGIILRTTTYGSIWIIDSSGTTNRLHSVSFTDANTGTAVGIRGTILRINNGGGVVTAVKERVSKTLPTGFSLMQNYPNPFNPTTVFTYQLPTTCHVRFDVFDILGRTVATLVNEKKSAGNYSLEYNASRLTSGVYFYRIQAGAFTETKKFLLLK